MIDFTRRATGRLEQHPLRFWLNNEIHARPPVALEDPQLISYLAITHRGVSAREELDHLRELGQAFAKPLPETEGEHLILDLDTFRLKWERHTEFSSYTFFRAPRAGDDPTRGRSRPYRRNGSPTFPAACWCRPTSSCVRPEAPPATVMKQLSAASSRQLVASQVADGAAWVFTDFLLTDGWSRFMVIDSSLTARQAGRTVQRLLEIETYRMTALLAFLWRRRSGHCLPALKVSLRTSWTKWAVTAIRGRARSAVPADPAGSRSRALGGTLDLSFRRGGAPITASLNNGSTSFANSASPDCRPSESSWTAALRRR